MQHSNRNLFKTSLLDGATEATRQHDSMSNGRVSTMGQATRAAQVLHTNALVQLQLAAT